MLSVPQEIQHQEFDDDEEYVPSSALLTNGPIAPNAASIRAAAKIVEQSQRTVIVVGKGAMAANAREAVISLANRTGALLATSLIAINWLRDAEEYHAGVSGLYSTKAAQELFQEADCVIAVGASLNLYTTEHGYLYPNASIIQIDHKAQIVMGDGRAAQCYVQADARLGVEALDACLADSSVHQIGFRTPEVKERLASALDDPQVYELEPGTLDPREACRVLDDVLPVNISLILGAGHQSNLAGMLFTRARPFTIINKSFGAIGHGLTTAMGAVVASGKRPALLTEGDAGFMMYLGEFETAVRYDLPILVAVFNNQSLASEVQKANLKGMNADLARISTPDLGKVGIALGGKGKLVRTIDELRHAAGEFVADPSPTLLDVRISANVLAIQYRRKFFGDDSV